MESNNDFWKNQSEQFEKSADYYDKYRPGYPEELISCIINETGITSDSKILEIGAGSGKATELFANKGFDMYCIEPGKSLAEAGQKKFSHTGRVKFYTCRFEEWDEIKGHFDLAISAQAFHWVPKPLGFQKCANALKPDGYIGLFWNLYLTFNEQVDNELAEVGMFLQQTEESCEERIKSHIREIESSLLFKEPEVFRFPWSQKYTTESYVGVMKTGNGYLSACESIRRAAENRVTDIINKNGGFITRHYLCVLFLAKKL